MGKQSLFQRIERLPVPVLPTMVGMATLSNVYASFGFSFVRHMTMLAATAVILVYLLKIAIFPKTCVKEYGNTVPSSLYAGFSMLLMILGSYYFEYGGGFGKGVWLTGLCIHVIHILLFTFRNVIKKRNVDTFVPSWFVTYNGILVACVVGGVMGEKNILTALTYYGITVYCILIPLLIYRIIKYEIKEGMMHTLAIVLAPCSLCVVSYLNVIDNPNKVLISLLYICVLASFCFILFRLPKFFSYQFSPAFAGLTFPMAIGIVASTKMSSYLAQADMEKLSEAVKQIAGLQLFITTVIIGFVLYNFLRMLFGVKAVLNNNLR